MVTLPHVSAEEPGRTIPMPTPQKHRQRPAGNAPMATQHYQLPSSNGSLAAPQQTTSQQQQQQLAWQMAQRAQQQPSHLQAQRQSALRQSALRQPSGLPQASWQQQHPQQQQLPQQQQQQGRTLVSQGTVVNGTQQVPGQQQRSIVQQWASNGMQAIPPGAYLIPQQVQGGGVSSGYLVQPQAQNSSAAQQGYSQPPSGQHMPGGFQHMQQMQRQQQYMPQAGRMVPVHDAQQRIAQNGQPSLLSGPRVSMQRMVPDFVPIAPIGCADGGSQRLPESANPLKRSYTGDFAAQLPPAKKVASLQQLHHALPVLRRPEDFKPF